MHEDPHRRRRPVVAPAAVLTSLAALGVVGVVGTAALGAGRYDPTVHYEVTGDDGDELASVVYGDGGAGKVEELGQHLPWREHVEPTYEVDVFRVVARGSSGAPLRCRVVIDDEVVADETSDGSSPVRCEGTYSYRPPSDD